MSREEIDRKDDGGGMTTNVEYPHNRFLIMLEILKKAFPGPYPPRTHETVTLWSDMDDEGNFPHELQGFIAFFQQKLYSIPEEYRASARIDYDTHPCGDYWMKIVYDVPIGKT